MLSTQTSSVPFLSALTSDDLVDDFFSIFYAFGESACHGNWMSLVILGCTLSYTRTFGIHHIGAPYHYLIPISSFSIMTAKHMFCRM